MLIPFHCLIGLLRLLQVLASTPLLYCNCNHSRSKIQWTGDHRVDTSSLHKPNKTPHFVPAPQSQPGFLWMLMHQLNQQLLSRHWAQDTYKL